MGRWPEDGGRSGREQVNVAAGDAGRALSAGAADEGRVGVRWAADSAKMMKVRSRVQESAP